MYEITKQLTAATEITSIALRQEAQLGGKWEAYAIKIDGGQRGDVLWYPEIGRGGVSTNADPVWSDAESVDDLLRRVLVTGEIRA